jgi:hypothetical protein
MRIGLIWPSANAASSAVVVRVIDAADVAYTDYLLGSHLGYGNTGCWEGISGTQLVDSRRQHFRRRREWPFFARGAL